MTNENDKSDLALEKTQKVLDNFLTPERKDEVERVLNEVGELYFTAPASSREEYHYCWPGGLALHSVNVFKNLIKLNKTFEANLNMDSMVVCSLFHDLGKAVSADLKTPHYELQEEDWKRRKGELYQFNRKANYMTNHLRSIFVLQHHGFRLTDEEFLAIYLNDGMYLESNRSYGLKEPKLSLFLHMADRLALEQEREEDV